MYNETQLCIDFPNKQINIVINSSIVQCVDERNTHYL